jgi:alkylation response protein AidB-like acyl-CoA dehydrogenase
VTIGVYGLAVTERAYEDMLKSAKERTAFGRPNGSFQPASSCQRKSPPS